MFKKSMTASAMAVMLASLVACGGGDDDAAPVAPPAPVAVGDTLVLTASGRLLSFNRSAPATLVGAVAVSGLASGETLLGIDMRPADGLLYGLGSGGRVYTIVASTGVATLKSTLKAAAGDDNPFATLTGTDFGVDFNPVADRLRVVSNTGANLRINVDNGDTITDGTIATATAGAAAITAAAYTNAFAGATTTALYDIDATTGLLHLQDPPNNGTLGAGVDLGVKAAAGLNGFDIDARTNTGYMVLTSGGSTGFYSVNLAATAGPTATRIGDVAGGEPVRGLALVQAAAPAVIGLTADNRLVAFDPKAPNTITATAIGGLAAGEIVVGIDVRPSDRLLYALTTTGKVYTIDPASGAATLKATLQADPADTSSPFAGLSGSVFSVDFNPAADRLRVISELGQSLRINVDTGATTTDGAINRAGALPSVVAAAYTNSFAGTSGTVLYDLEANSDVLTRQDPPNNGTLVNIGALGLDVNGMAGFDIGGGANGLVLAAVRNGGSGPYSLYTVSLATGAASLYRNTGDAALSQIGGAGGPALRDIAIRF